MATYTIYLPPAGLPERQVEERTRFIREAGSLPALLVPALWLAFQRLWFALVVYLLVTAILAILSRITDNQALNLLGIVPAIYLFLEGRELVRARLERKGWRFAGVVEAADMAEAEERWFAAHPPAARPVVSPAVPSAGSSNPAGPADPEPSIGIFGP